MTYSIALETLTGLWDVLFLGRREYATRVLIGKEGAVGEGLKSVGHGKVAEGFD